MDYSRNQLLVVSFEILRKTNQANNNQITAACLLNQMKIAA